MSKNLDFHFFSAGLLTTAFNVLDYEELTTHSVTMTILVSDGMDWSNSTLTLEIIDVNEEPSIHQTKYILTPPEEGVVRALHWAEPPEPHLPILLFGSISILSLAE